MKPKPRVAIVYRFLPHYRQPFFEQLRPALDAAGIELDVFYGRVFGAEGKKGDQVELDWGIPYGNLALGVGKRHLIYQPLLARLRNYDLVIVEQANKLLLNYFLMAWRRLGGPRFAFWGHGRNLQESAGSLLNRFKYSYLDQCDWWFAYTEGVKVFLASKGVNPAVVTVVQNAADTSALLADAAENRPEDLAAFRHRHGIDGPVGLYCGGLYPQKRLGDLIAACDEVHRAIPAFHLLVVGAGQDLPLIELAAATRPWLKYLGPLFGREKALAFQSADLFLLPGLVGLAIVDCFGMGVPLVTRAAEHSPEIEYLESGVNGLYVGGGLDEYARAVIGLLQNPVSHGTLRAGCLASGQKYTMRAMVNNFARGVEAALAK